MIRQIFHRLGRFSVCVLIWLVVIYTLGWSQAMRAQTAQCTDPTAGSKNEYLIASGVLGKDPRTGEFQVKTAGKTVATIQVEQQSFLSGEINNFAGSRVQLFGQQEKDTLILEMSVKFIGPFIGGDSPFLLGEAVIGIRDNCMVDFVNKTFDQKDVRFTLLFAPPKSGS